MAKSKHFALKADKRDRAGKGVARALRREDRLPGVVYGDHKEPVLISLPAKEVGIEYHKGHMFTNLCDLDVAGDKMMVLARDVQLHPVTDRVLHVDFLRVTPKTKINVMVPVHFTNQDQCPGIHNKGTLNVVRHEVELMCAATAIPETLDIDLSAFAIGDTIKISAAAMPSGAAPVIDDRDFTIATIVAPKSAAAVAAEEAAEEAAETAAAEAAEAAVAAEDGEES
ncbi:MAG: 50S ribosomal protein L25/general stress protein Ctc [Alphaproteobacteria bacterium]|nr:50S ribosomal protein L25/general stress protein Ctc [Alphaproteobacteria bacterium]